MHKGLATVSECVLPGLPNTAEYEAALQELEGRRTQVYTSGDHGASACATTTIKVATRHPSSIHNDLLKYAFT